MEKIVSKRELKRNFLELCNQLSNDESKALVNLDNLEKIEGKLAEFCTEAYPLSYVLLMYHRYAAVAFVSAEFMVNAKIFIDEIKSKYIIISMVNKPDPDELSVVYSNVDALSRYPMRAISMKDIISFLEEQDIEASLLAFFKQRKTF